MKVNSSVIAAAVSLIDSKLIITDRHYEYWTEEFLFQLQIVSRNNKFRAEWDNPTEAMHPLHFSLKGMRQRDAVAWFSETKSGYEFYQLRAANQVLARSADVRNGKDLINQLMAYFHVGPYR